MASTAQASVPCIFSLRHEFRSGIWSHSFTAHDGIASAEYLLHTFQYERGKIFLLLMYHSKPYRVAEIRFWYNKMGKRSKLKVSYRLAANLPFVACMDSGIHV